MSASANPNREHECSQDFSMYRDGLVTAPASHGREARAQCGDDPATRLRLVSYNVHGCVGRDRKLDLERVVAVIKEMPADVVALQEVPTAEHGREFLRLARAATGLVPVTGPLFEIAHAHHANAVLTRCAVRAAHPLNLTVRRYAPRGAIDVDLMCNGTVVRVIATHLGLRPGERRQQIQRLLLTVRRADLKPVVLLGDINEWLAWGRPLRWLHRHFRKPPAMRSFPSGLPLFALDRIWVSRPGRVVTVQTHRTPLARLASDHLPVVGLVEFYSGRNSP